MATRKKKNQKILEPLPPFHPWRICPYGEHWVRTHPLHVSPSDNYPEGHTTLRHEHCANNPSGKDHLYPEEIAEVAKQNFQSLNNKPCPLAFEFDNGSAFDDLIAGWTRYWNEVLKPDEPLDPNFVKALVLTKSGFEPEKLAKKKDANSARGLLQIINQTRMILSDSEGELRDHFITLTRQELNDPVNNICAGIRWLFYKRAWRSHLLKRQATWREAVHAYKAADKERKKLPGKDIMSIFDRSYEALKKCKTD